MREIDDFDRFLRQRFRSPNQKLAYLYLARHADKNGWVKASTKELVARYRLSHSAAAAMIRALCQSGLATRENGEIRLLAGFFVDGQFKAEGEFYA